MRGSSTMWLLIVAGIIRILLGIYYLIPGIYHPFTFSGTPTDSHKTHAIVFFVLGIVAFIASRFFRPAVR